MRFEGLKTVKSKAILSPTVPEGQERLRFFLHSYNSPEEISEVLELLSVFFFRRRSKRFP
jgi:8-amino-7-oxononanoate synthase